MADRKSGILEVRNVWYEPGVRETRKLANALDMNIKRLARFNDCGQVRTKE